MTADLCKHQGI